jgi:hypothetical protein
LDETRDVHKREIVACGLLVACCDTPELLEASEEDFDEVAFLVHMLVVIRRADP